MSGDLARSFGPGIKNIRVRLRTRLGRLVTHTHYWDAAAIGEEIVDDAVTGRSHLAVMRDAVDLLRHEEFGQTSKPIASPSPEPGAGSI